MNSPGPAIGLDLERNLRLIPIHQTFTRAAAWLPVFVLFIAPVTERRHRATLLSLDSLAGRLGYGVLLLVISVDAGDDVQNTLTALAITSWTLVALLFVTAAWAAGLRRRPS